MEISLLNQCDVSDPSVTDSVRVAPSKRNSDSDSPYSTSDIQRPRLKLKLDDQEEEESRKLNIQLYNGQNEIDLHTKCYQTPLPRRLEKAIIKFNAERNGDVDNKACARVQGALIRVRLRTVTAPNRD